MKAVAYCLDMVVEYYKISPKCPQKLKAASRDKLISDVPTFFNVKQAPDATGIKKTKLFEI